MKDFVNEHRIDPTKLTVTQIAEYVVKGTPRSVVIGCVMFTDGHFTVPTHDDRYVLYKDGIKIYTGLAPAVGRRLKGCPLVTDE